MAATLVVIGVLGGAPASLAHAGLFFREGDRAVVGIEFVDERGQCYAPREMDLSGCRPLPDPARATLRWQRIEPIAGDYDNVAACARLDAGDSCHAPIRYRSVPVPTLDGRNSFAVSAVAPLAAAGAHRITVSLRWHGKTVEAPGSDAHEVESFAKAYEVVVRAGDDYVGRASELIGVPFALGPVLLPGIGHETDRRIAADCIALVIYGQRRLGRAVPYMAPKALRPKMQEVGHAQALVDEDGVVANVGDVQRGDVLDFGFQTAVLARPPGIIGPLTGSDSVLHTYHGLAEETRVDALPYRQHPVDVFRWRRE